MTVYKGTALSDQFLVDVPELEPGDMQLLSVYVPYSNLPPTDWSELPYEDRTFLMHKRRILIENCTGLPYMIAVVK